MLTLLEEFGFSRSESLLLPQALLRNRSGLFIVLEHLAEERKTAKFLTSHQNWHCSCR